MLRSTALLLLVLVGGSPGDPPKSYDPAAARELAGLWQARQRFGPDIRGPLVLQRHVDYWIAEVAGRRAVAQWRGDTITFELDGGEGSFRGHLVHRQHRIEGHWIQPPTT